MEYPMIELDKLNQEISELAHKEILLSAEARSEAFIPRKRKLITKRTKLSEKLAKLKAQKMEYKEKEAAQDIEELLQKNRVFIHLTLNQRKIDIPENLEIDIKFYPCNHKGKKNLAEFLRSYTTFQSKRIPCPNINLLDLWRDILNTDCTPSGRFTCPKCKENDQSRLKKLIHSNKKQFGWVNFSLRKMR